MNSSIEMDPALAKWLLTEGATLVLVGIPQKTEFGIDMKTWNTAEKFLGVKLIPPGLHYIHYSAVNKHGDTAPRIGFLYNFKKSEIVVRKWDKTNEEISTEMMSNENIERIKDNLENIDRFLGVYPYDIWNLWKNLTDKINIETYGNMIPICGQIRSALELLGSTDDERKTLNDSSENSPVKHTRRSGIFTDEEKDGGLLPDLTPVPGTELRLTKLPERNYPAGCTPSEITKHSLDSSYVLECVLSQYTSTSDILSELQFTFICFLIGHSLEAFEQWKKLIGVLCSVEESLPKYTSIYLDILSVLNFQLQEIPQDFLVDIVASNNFIYKCLRNLFRILKENNIDSRLKSKGVRFQESLTQNFGWDFSDLDEIEEEDLPVIVAV